MNERRMWLTSAKNIGPKTYTVLLFCPTAGGPVYRILESRVKSRKQAFRLALVWSLSWAKRLTGLPKGDHAILIQTNKGRLIAKIRCCQERS
jgi:hypothetical protein